VRAIGFAVPERGGIVTVSMNLIDHDVTGLRAAFDAVAAEAVVDDLSITDGEIVGLVPSTALGEGDIGYLRLSGFDPERQILERLIEAEEEEGTT
jgi:glutamate formiminotransferase